MSRPIKVSDELFQALSKHAEEDGVSMQQALHDRLDSYQQDVRRLDIEKKHLLKDLARQERALQAAQNNASNSESLIRKLQSERDRLKAMIEQTGLEQTILEEQHEELRSELAVKSSALEASSARQQELHNQWNTVLNIIIVVGIVFATGYLIRKLFPAKSQENQPVPELSQVVPPWYL